MQQLPRRPQASAPGGIRLAAGGSAWVHASSLCACFFVFVLCSGAGDSKPSLDAIKAQLAAAGNKSKALKPKLPGFPKAGAAAAAGAGVAAGQQLLAGSSSGLYDDGEEEDEDWDEDESTPAFEITFDETGFAVGSVCGVQGLG